jgi:hypothetical protein
MTDKKQWGGKRPNQTGRPPARQGVRRVGFHCMVDPATRDLVKQISEQTGRSAGQVVDDLAAEHCKRSDSDSIDSSPEVNLQG